MAKPDHQELIDLCEDPHETLEGVGGDPATAERLEQVAELADSLFFQSTLEEKVWDTLHLPTRISARRLSRLPEPERTEILSQLPPRLTEELASLLPATVF